MTQIEMGGIDCSVQTWSTMILEKIEPFNKLTSKCIPEREVENRKYSIKIRWCRVGRAQW